MFVEVKREGEEPTPNQQENIDFLRYLGYTVLVLTDPGKEVETKPIHVKTADLDFYLNPLKKKPR